GKGKAARLEDTITKTNLEAAEEVVNQLRLRDIGGIIVIDFIDMARARNRDTVLKTLRKSLDEDRTKTFVVEISPLGLVEMTRQNVTDGVREIMTKTCPVCGGEGVVKSEETMAIHVARHLREMGSAKDAPEAFLVRLNSRVTAWFIADGARELQALEADTGRFFHFTGSEGLPLDHFSVVMEGTRDEVAEEAVPFRGGEEVHVDIVEPHMYNPDDAVAKVDGYVITVTNGVAFVGEKKLVRIEEARRTTATAELTGADAEAAAAAADERAKEREKVEQRAKRSAAAKKGAAKRKEREAAKKKPSPAAAAKEAEAEAEAEAVEALTDTSDAGAGTGPAAAEDAGEDAPKPRRRRGGRGRSRARGSDNGDTVATAAEEDVSDAEEPADDSSNGDAVESKPRRRGRRGGRRRSRAKAGAEAAEASKADE
ncbi:MAG TPA: ribonuclease E/G, partial [Solirubrobacteraceae bacterium]|nr:ribonuclease E/G [Solirubrobacteraceae bacterium]